MSSAGPLQLLSRLRRLSPDRLALLLLVALAAGLWIAAINSVPRALEVVALAVGDGDAYLIRTPTGRCVLWDGGSRSMDDVGARVLVPNLLLLGVHRLDAIIITHPDSDHVNGLPAVIDALPVRRLLDPELPEDNTAYRQVADLCRLRGIPHFALRAGDRLHLDRRVRLSIMAPGRTLLHGTNSDTNNNCLVGLLEYRGTRLLLTGDLETEGEQALFARKPDLRAQVMTVAHHGSHTGTTAALLDAVRPAIAVISTRGDAFGRRPDSGVLARLRDRGIQVLRTDVHGQVRLRSDGRRWHASTYREAGR